MTDVPKSVIWVDSNGSSKGDGGLFAPLSSIHAAVLKATPGTAVIVRAGTYEENVKLPSFGGGTPGAPCQLVFTRDATLRAKNLEDSAVKGLSVHDWKIFGIGPGPHITDAANGIQFGLSGTDYTKPGAISQRITVQGMVIRQCGNDAIKISQAEHVDVLDNDVGDTGEQGIDFVAVNSGRILRNSVHDIQNVEESQGINAKGGSTDVLIENNLVFDISKIGIAAGGYSGNKAAFRPEFSTYEGRNIVVRGNDIRLVGSCPVQVVGAIDTMIEGNNLQGNPLSRSAPYAIGVLPGMFWPFDPGFLRVKRNLTNMKTLVLWDKGKWGRTMPTFIEAQPYANDLPLVVGPRSFEPWPGFAQTIRGT
jgi:serralysin